MSMYDAFIALVVAIVAGLNAWLGFAVPSEPTTDSAEMATSSSHVVIRVIDGDTFDIDTGERVRLLGVDTPERDECYFTEATEFLRAWLEGEMVRLESDVRDQDVYDRLLRYVFVDRVPDGTSTSTELLVNDVLLQKGYADYLPIGPDRQYRLQFRASYESAQMAELGRWGACT